MNPKKNSDRKPMSRKELEAEQEAVTAALKRMMTPAQGETLGGAALEADQGIRQGITGPNGASLAKEARLFRCQAAISCGKKDCYHAKDHEWSATNACSTTYWCVPLVHKLSPGFNNGGAGMAGQGEYGAEMIRLIKMGMTKSPICVEVTK